MSSAETQDKDVMKTHCKEIDYCSGVSERQSFPVVRATLTVM